MTDNSLADPTDEDAKLLVSDSAFQKNYNKILRELDALANGVYDETEGPSVAALCLLAQASLNKILTSCEQKARGLKRDIDFAKAEAYYKLKQEKVDGKKLAEAALAQLVLRDEEVNKLYNEHNAAEKEAREVANLMNILKDAHITFRGINKKAV